MLIRDEYGFHETPSGLPSSKTPVSKSACSKLPSSALDPSKSSASQCRSSTRTLKRKRLNNSAVKTTSNLQPSAPKSSRSSVGTRSKAGSNATFDDFAIPSIITPETVTKSVVQPDRIKKKQTGSSASSGAGRKNSKNKNQTHFNHALKGLGRWKPTDDLALITGVEQTNDLKIVHKGTKFSCHFTLQEVQHRWHALLYDSDVSKLAVQAMRNLHPEVIASVQSRALFSKAEEYLLETVKLIPEPTLEVFRKLLETNPQTFHSARTAKVLMYHWQLMKHYQLLPDQSVQLLPSHDNVGNFSDTEDMINDKELADQKKDLFNIEMAIADRHNKRKIRVLENELSRWLVRVDNLTGAIPPDFDNQTLAILKGKLVKYCMKSEEITIGRSTKDHSVDVDLTLEGPARKVSRRQATIRMRSNGDFFLCSEGKRPVFVDGRPILAGNKFKLKNNSIIEVASFQCVFLINQDLRSVIRQEWERNFKAQLKPLK
ncbi:microspherule protein 1 isoform X2 [Diachasma alloeum]|nr:microspherule protein 1 isoform X2 [Diachasma alloeum]XP_015120990.1 microspherule protein 1 isoform X2 [Diachasma alloeum]